MRAIQRAIVGVGLATVAIVAMALLIGGLRSFGPDPSAQPAPQASGPQVPLAEGPTGPPEPVDAAEDTSVGTLPPRPDDALATQLASRDLLAPPEAAPNARKPAEGSTLSARKAPGREKSDNSSGQMPTMPEQGFTTTHDAWDWNAWDWSEWADADNWYGDRDRDDCRRGHRSQDRFDRRDYCQDEDRRD